jgi:hypothetical protein
VTLTVTQPNGDEINLSATVPAGWNGEDAIEITVPAFFEGTYTNIATVTNAEGQTSPASAPDSFILDKTAPGEDSTDTITEPQLAISEAQGDSIVTPAEAADGVQIQVTVPESTLAGDTVTVTVVKPDNSTVDVAVAVPTNWNGNDAIEVTIPVTDVTSEGEYVTTATVTDAAGNVSEVSNIKLHY